MGDPFRAAPHVVVPDGPNGAGPLTVAPRLLRDALGIVTLGNTDALAGCLPTHRSTPMNPDPSDETIERDVGTLIRDGARMASTVARAQVETVRGHRLLGQPIVVWRDGQAFEEVPPAGPDAPGPGER